MLRPRMAGWERKGFHLEGSSSALWRIAARRCFCVSRVVVQRGCAGWNWYVHPASASRMIVQRGLRRLALSGLSGLRFLHGRTAGGVCRLALVCSSGFRLPHVCMVWVWRLALPGLSGLRFPRGRTAGVCRLALVCSSGLRFLRWRAAHAPGRNAKKRRSHLWLRRFAAPFYAGSRCSAATAQ